MGQLLDRNSSQIAFYRRVFDEARDEGNPLLERVKFLGILGASADDAVASNDAAAAGLTALVSEARSYFSTELLPALASNGVRVLDYSELTAQERALADAYFHTNVFPVLVPLGLDAARPFPHLAGRSVALSVVTSLGGDERFACVEIPRSLPSLVHLERNGERLLVWLHTVVSANLAALFPDATALSSYPFRCVRDNRIATVPGSGQTLRDTIEAGLLRREFGDVRSVSVDETMPRSLMQFVATRLGVGLDDVDICRGFVDLASLEELSRIDVPRLRAVPISPKVRTAELFDELRTHDILLHHPFDSFQTVIDFVKQAAADPDVLAISTTLYRAGKNSPIVKSLLDAQRAGKRVRVVIELRARLDEAHNLAWGYALEQAGAHVAYGTLAFKVHAKMTLVVRRERESLRRYVHLSSGNYNPATASLYTDVGLLTSREDVCSDAGQLFNAMSGYGFPSRFRRLLVAPVSLRLKVAELIAREAQWAAGGSPAHMVLKMNALSDPEIIEALYRASQAGARIDLIVRGICLLRPGVRGLSDNIRVRSIVGRFLEHSRAWYFRNGGCDEVYVGSADLMPRNLDERIEVMVPIDDEAVKYRVRHDILGVYLRDNVKARELGADGSYVRVAHADAGSRINSQESFQ